MANDGSTPNFQLPRIGKGQPITADYLNSMSENINRFTKGCRPPSQVFATKSGGSSHVAAKLASTVGNVSPTGNAKIDNVDVVTGDLVLLCTQTTPTQNGVWKVKTTGDWSNEGQPDLVSVTHGARWFRTLFSLTAENIYTDIAYNRQVDNARCYTTGGTLTGTGQTFDGVGVGNGTKILYNGNALQGCGVYMAVTASPWIFLGTPQTVYIVAGTLRGGAVVQYDGASNYDFQGAVWK